MTDIAAIIEQQRQFFLSGKTREKKFRWQQLKKLKSIIFAEQQQITAALNDDFGKSEFEAYVTEIGILGDEITRIYKKLGSWMKAKKVGTPLSVLPGCSYICAEPYGVCLIIAPWNYPFQLAISPLIGAIAAGNCAIVKPSEYAPATSRVIAQLIKKNFPQEFIAVVEGDVKTSEELLKQQFDLIFFTGSPQVGKIVMRAAADHLTPVVLELGGKSPCIVDSKTNVELAAKRIVWGKFLNAGQTCVAPDYVLAHQDIKVPLLEKMKDFIHIFYGEDPQQSPDFPRIINDRHFQRLQAFIGNGNVVSGGQYDAKARYIAPTILDDIDWQSPIMQEEIFGPILPIMTYHDLENIINDINSRPRPLALYIFSDNKKHCRQVLNSISFGGGCVNDTILHLANPNLPFGGVGTSGIGSYHGKASFSAFSHHKSILKKFFFMDLPFRYPPYKGKLGFIKKIIK